MGPTIDTAGEIRFPADEEQQKTDYRAMDDDNIAGALADDLIGTLNRRGISNRAIQRHIVEKLWDWLDVRTSTEVTWKLDD
jgi:hypothetical protein